MKSPRIAWGTEHRSSQRADHIPIPPSPTAATGIPEEFITHACSLRVAKINTDSDLRLVTLGRMRQILTERPDIFSLHELMGEVEDAMRVAVEARIRLRGGERRAG